MFSKRSAAGVRCLIIPGAVRVVVGRPGHSDVYTGPDGHVDRHTDIQAYRHTDGQTEVKETNKRTYRNDKPTDTRTNVIGQIETARSVNPSLSPFFAETANSQFQAFLGRSRTTRCVNSIAWPGKRRIGLILPSVAKLQQHDLLIYLLAGLASILFVCSDLLAKFQEHDLLTPFLGR